MIYGRNRIWQLINNKNIELKDDALKKYKSYEGVKGKDYVSGCNCDLEIGDECYLSDSGHGDGVFRLVEGRYYEIKPMGILLFETDAIFHIPDDCAFRLSLRMKYIKKGLMMSNLPLGQPGYDGRLFGIIMNVSTKPVAINYRERILTLEIVGITDNDLEGLKPVEPGSDDGRLSLRMFAENAISSSFKQELDSITAKNNTIKADTEKSLKQITDQAHFQMRMLTILSIILTILTVFISIRSFS